MGHIDEFQLCAYVFNTKIQMLKNLGLLLILIGNTILSHAVIPERTGWWKFDNPSELLKPEGGVGATLNLVGSHSAAEGPEIGNGAVLVGTGSYYKMNHSIPPNGGGNKVNEYSLQVDFKIPQSDLWHCFFQTTLNNGNDGDFFINPSGNIGVAATGYSETSIVQNEWYRLILSVKNGNQFTAYLDGKLLLKGVSQAIDGRFSLESQLLIFADDNGEDAPIYCSELSIWNRALTALEANELGGFGHQVELPLMTRIPYLQAPGQTSMTVSWHDTIPTGTKVEYGLDSLNLLLEKSGSSEIISLPYRWHSVKLANLQANTRYFYRVGNGVEFSKIYSFKTLPDNNYKGKIRFILLSDTHASDTTMAGQIMRAARSKVSELYGADLDNQVNGIFHSGDIVVSGSVPDQYTKQYFKPLSCLSPYLSTLVVAGNHEGESPFFYRYLKLDELSAYPQLSALNEKIWNLRVGNSLFLGLNTNIIDVYGTTQANWLDLKLKEAEQDPGIDFVFLFLHHPPYSELWQVVNTFDAGANYVRDILFPIIKKYTKVQQLNYGHTHGFERGTIHSDQPDGDFRIICGGGGGGPLDPWAPGENKDYPDIHICYSNYFFQILEIDLANHSWQNSMYSLGNTHYQEPTVLLDQWYRTKNQAAPATPKIENTESTNGYVQVNTSSFSGPDSLMSVQFQLIEKSDNPKVVLDTFIHWTNIYGVSDTYKPIDLNLNINMNQLLIRQAIFKPGITYNLQVRYRDHNLKWSDWSPQLVYQTTEIENQLSEKSDGQLFQNYPNPFCSHTTINYKVTVRSEIHFRIYDLNSHLVTDINEGIKPPGQYSIVFKAEHLNSGIYFYQMITREGAVTKKMIKMD